MTKPVPRYVFAYPGPNADPALTVDGTSIGYRIEIMTPERRGAILGKAKDLSDVDPRLMIGEVVFTVPKSPNRWREHVARLLVWPERTWVNDPPFYIPRKKTRIDQVQLDEAESRFGLTLEDLHANLLSLRRMHPQFVNALLALRLEDAAAYFPEDDKEGVATETLQDFWVLRAAFRAQRAGHYCAQVKINPLFIGSLPPDARFTFRSLLPKDVGHYLTRAAFEKEIDEGLERAKDIIRKIESGENLDGRSIRQLSEKVGGKGSLKWLQDKAANDNAPKTRKEIEKELDEKLRTLKAATAAANFSREQVKAEFANGISRKADVNALILGCSPHDYLAECCIMLADACARNKTTLGQAPQWLLSRQRRGETAHTFFRDGYGFYKALPRDAVILENEGRYDDVLKRVRKRALKGKFGVQPDCDAEIKAFFEKHDFIVEPMNDNER